MSDATCQLPGFWRSALSGKDNQSIDIVRLLGCAGVVVYFLLSGHAQVVQGHTFEPVTWCTALAGLILAIGGGVKLKQSAEPGA